MNRINLDVRDLEAVLALANSGSFRAAAERLGMSQPSLTTRIQGIEATLGLTLFRRTTRRVEITEVGERLRDRAFTTLAQLRSLLLDFEDETKLRRGRVTLGATATVSSGLVPPVLSAFHRRWPHIDVTLLDDFFGRDLRRLKSGETDLAVLPFDPDEREFRFDKLMNDDFVFVVPVGHPLLDNPAVALARAASYPMLSFPERSAAWGTFARAFAAAGIEFRPAFVTTSMPTLIAMVRAELGITLVPRLALSEMNTAGLAILPVDGPGLHRQIGVVSLRERALSPAATALADTFRRHAVSVGVILAAR